MRMMANALTDKTVLSVIRGGTSTDGDDDEDESEEEPKSKKRKSPSKGAPYSVSCTVG